MFCRSSIVRTQKKIVAVINPDTVSLTIQIIFCVPMPVHKKKNVSTKLSQNDINVVIIYYIQMNDNLFNCSELSFNYLFVSLAQLNLKTEIVIQIGRFTYLYIYHHNGYIMLT